MIKFGFKFFFYPSSNYKLLINTCSRDLSCPDHLLICFRKVCHPITAINKPSSITGQFSPTDPPLLIGQSVSAAYSTEFTWVGCLATPPSSVMAMRGLRLNIFWSLQDSMGPQDKIGKMSTKKKAAISLMPKSHQPAEEEVERLRVLGKVEGTQGVRGMQGADSDNYTEVFDSILLSDSSFSTSFSSSSSSCPCCPPPPLPPRQLCPQAPPRPPYPSTWIVKINV